MSDKKKVFSTGRFGARYGVGIRKRVIKIELKQKQKYSCPTCISGRLKRLDRGIFLCRKCRTSFAGGTFVPQTLTGGIIKKMVTQKKFLPLQEELALVQEEETEKLSETFNKEEETPVKKQKTRGNVNV